MAGMFKKATRQRARLRMGLCGPSGAGKTYTGLRLAFALAEARGKEEGRPGRVAVIDSESGSASKYVGERPDGTPWDFDVVELVSFSPDRYTEALGAAAAEKFDVVLVDSLSHAWEGKDGALEMVDRKAGQNNGNSFTAWKDVTPHHRRMVEALLTSPCDVICTLRAKTEYVLQENEKGKKVPVKIGVGAIQRAGMEYEFDVFGELDLTHTLTITKTRCSVLDGATVVKPGPAFMAPLIAWLTTGETVEIGQAHVRVDDSAERGRLTEQVLVQSNRIGWSQDRVAKDLHEKYGRPLAELTLEQLAEFAGRLARFPDKKPPVVTEEVPPKKKPSEPSNLVKAKALRDQLFSFIAGEKDRAAAWSAILQRYGVTTAKDLKPADWPLFLLAVEHEIQHYKDGGDPFGGAVTTTQPEAAAPVAPAT